jgi:hypothetical protein
MVSTTVLLIISAKPYHVNKMGSSNFIHMLILIKPHRKLAVPPEEALRYIEKLVLLNLNQRVD